MTASSKHCRPPAQVADSRSRSPQLAHSVKHGLLRVPDGPVVSEPSARAMVTSVAELLGADLAVAVTGVGGPQPQDGQPAGTVWFGVFAGGAARTELHHFAGDPGDVVEATTAHALFLLDDALRL